MTINAVSFYRGGGKRGCRMGGGWSEKIEQVRQHSCRHMSTYFARLLCNDLVTGHGFEVEMR